MIFIKRCNDKYLSIGTNYNIDPLAIVGEKTARKIEDKTLKIGRNAVIRSGSIIYEGTSIGDNFNTGHYVIVREENKIGDNVSIWSNSIIDYGCEVGNNVKIHSQVYVTQFTVIEDNVFLAPGVITGNDLHPGCEKSRECLKGPIIKKGAQVGLNVTLLPYITIGEKALIGAGSVVTRDIPPGKVAYGNPAKVVADITDVKCIHTPPWVERPYLPKG
jgi:acetyltransferase-like isoleucine patch superfamily enzyme